MDPPDMRREMSMDSQLGGLSSYPSFHRPVSGMSVSSTTEQSARPSRLLSPEMGAQFDVDPHSSEESSKPEAASSAVFRVFGDEVSKGWMGSPSLRW